MPESNKHTPRLGRNVRNVVWGETVGSAVALASVFAARKILPAQTEHITARLTAALERNGKRTPEEARKTAERVVVIVLMNIGGLASVLTQFGMRRMMNDAHQYSLPVDLSALLVGRIGGTTTMTAGIYGTEKLAGNSLRATEEVLAKGIHWINNKALGSQETNVSDEERRAAYVVVSNILQSIYAIPGNAGAQTFVERIADGRKTGPERG